MTQFSYIGIHLGHFDSEDLHRGSITGKTVPLMAKSGSLPVSVRDPNSADRTAQALQKERLVLLSITFF